MVKAKSQINIGFPVFNGDQYMRQALDSLLAQDFTDFELIISDNGSTDKTQDICREYVRKDPRVKYHRSDVNHGATWNFNRVFELASADFFMWAAHDDYWQPQYIRTCIEAFKGSKDIVLAGSICEYIDGNTGKHILVDPGLTTVGMNATERFKKYKKAVHGRNGTNAIFYGVYRRQALATVMPFKKFMANDHLLMAELSLSGEFITVPDSLMIKRRGGSSVTFAQLARSLNITNPLMARCPYFVREIILQDIIGKAKQLSFFEKVSLSCWSWMDYFILFLKHIYWSLRPHQE